MVPGRTEPGSAERNHNPTPQEDDVALLPGLVSSSTIHHRVTEVAVTRTTEAQEPEEDAENEVVAVGRLPGRGQQGLGLHERESQSVQVPNRSLSSRMIGQAPSVQFEMTV
jgi:hypothetical protein